ncbi:hypothetical protein HZU75_07700 [Chitinibacter fontanus]|uniref:LTD domain-containing protein n=1 Tax=Chitinibacter fontanus TaxID=1737446 RepID=A0A7D5ZE34_9NEIS|nr:zinc-dependent metalloprotease family protein [Chitinibacter fontanus]QLI81424.1 hypothetical protein HZU75_07700 [Chitinibacter fontanus]
MKHLPLTLLAVSVSLALLACGGGGGGGGSATPTAAPSYTPPPADAVSADPTIPAPQAITLQSGSLLISEISNSGWIEIYNTTDFPIDVSRMKVRTRDTSGLISEFALPAATILPKGYLVVAARPSTDIQSSNQVVFVGTTSLKPNWGSSNSGFVELTIPGQTIDFVRFGSGETTAPTSPSEWGSGNAPALDIGSDVGSTYGHSIVRPASSINSDTNLGTDWQPANFSTPFGPNDVPSGALDADNDGIPDSAEVAGGTFAGLDLYAMGARAGQRDIFLEIDYMSAADEGVKPRPEALQKIVAAFAAKGFSLHIDAGANVAGFNLGNAKSVLAYNSCLDMGNPKLGCADVYALKTNSFDLRRSPIFHYAVMGYKSGTYAGAAGLGEISGNDFYVALGGLGLSAKSTLEKNFLINTQAGTIMHELGHNLGLRHGGFEDQNSKPNYISVMNYMYSQAGIPPNVTGVNAGQRWYINNNLKGLGLCTTEVEANTCSDTFILDYSNGNSLALNEQSLLESELLGRGSTVAGAFVDWNRDGLNTTSRISANIDSPDSTVVSSVPLRDYNDWANLILPFARQFSGRLGKTPGSGTVYNDVHFLNDRQPVASEQPMVKPMP